MTTRIMPLRADDVLLELVAASDIFDIDGRKFMVTILTDRRIEDLVVAMAASEDEEPGSDDEPSLAYSSGDIFRCAHRRCRGTGRRQRTGARLGQHRAAVPS